jgi:hypothetical protein
LKKTLAFILLTSIILPFTGYYSWLTYQKSIAKKEIKQRIISGLHKTELKLLVFSKVDSEVKLKWEHAHEFEYMHQMYDVIETEIHGDSLYYFCWADHEETLLNKKLNQLLASVMANPLKENKQQKQIIDFYKSLSLPANIHIPLVNKFCLELIYPNYPSLVMNFFGSIPSPPPKAF